MPLLSPEEDFAQRTLAHLGGALPRLHYVAGLRDASGRYRHWGLARSFGEDAANQTAAIAHERILCEVLRKPLSSLYSELQQWDVATAAGADRCLAEMVRSTRRLLPSAASPASEQHLSSILVALYALARARRANPNLPAA